MKEQDDTRVLALLYDTSDFGRLVVQEYPAQQSLSDWLEAAKATVGDTGQPGYYGSAELVTLADGAQGLLTTTPNGKLSVMEWLEDDVDMTVMGPQLDKAGATRYANLVVSDSGSG
ncbi:MAG: hypothetical protein HY240_00375 [Actinobacteria bacterium]|nr:hypothetical protein [Actinomycetota bacterium]